MKVHARSLESQAALKARVARYPKNWRAISAAIRARSGGRCECNGECGLHRTTPGPRRCEERQGERARWARGKVVLTVAHLDHDPANCDPANLRAFCNRCHLRYDAPLHVKHSAETRRRKLKAMYEAAGQLEMAI